MQRVEASLEGRRVSTSRRRSSSTFLHSHLAMIPAGSKSGSVLLPGTSSTASTPALQVSTHKSIESCACDPSKATPTNKSVVRQYDSLVDILQQGRSPGRLAQPPSRAKPSWLIMCRWLCWMLLLPDLQLDLQYLAKSSKRTCLGR